MFINKKFNEVNIKKYLSKIGHVMVQKFLPKVKFGDKRVFILNGKVKGAIKRVPAFGASKLTELMKEVLSGNTRTLMIGCLAPTQGLFED